MLYIFIFLIAKATLFLQKYCLKYLPSKIFLNIFQNVKRKNI